MPNYANGKIYKICSNVTGLKYIGSTTADKLATRLADQASKCRMHYMCGTGSYATSFEVLKGGCGTYYIELIRHCPCTSRDELGRRMGEIIRATDCVNKVVPGRTPEQYRLECPEKAKEKFSKYYKKNVETVAAKAKMNSERNNELQRKRYAANPKVYTQQERDRVLVT
jgi:hypothetical protein